MPKKELWVVIYTITVLLSVMYATQPLQPLLAIEFNVSTVKASSFTAVIMFFLSVAPIIYGYILERISARKLLLNSSIILFFTNIVLSLSQSYEMFLTARIVEAIIIPAILTSCMSILAQDKVHIKRNMSIYVAATVFGGLVGRLISGFMATEFGWRSVFFSLSLALLITVYLVKTSKFNVQTKLTKATFTDIKNILKDRRFGMIYLLMFITFFVFAGLLNILPFRIKDLFPNSSETQIGILYLGYGMGILVSLGIFKIVKIFRGEVNTILAGIIVFALSNLFFHSQNLFTIFIMVFVLCLGMFTVHTVSTRLANSLRESQKALTSGMYLSFYYIGGTVGSIVPPLVYDKFGWDYTLWMFILVNIISFGLIYYNRNIFSTK